MSTTTRLAAAAATALLAAGCGSGGKPASAEAVALQWFKAHEKYDYGATWELEAPPQRFGTKAEAEARGERDRVCDESSGPGCSPRSPVRSFEAAGQRREGDCIRAVVRTNYRTGNAVDDALLLAEIDGDWRVIYRFSISDRSLDDELLPQEATVLKQMCGVS